MEPRCPLCHVGLLEEKAKPDGSIVIQCSEYPACRFEADGWERLSETAARFHYPIKPGHS